MTDLTLSIAAARSLQLATLGLLQPPPQPATKTSVLAAIRAMGALQIDTIHVVARSPYLVLFSRLGEYDQRWLEDLLAEGALFEYWAHAASFLPIEDFALYRRFMLDGSRGYRYSFQWASEHPDEVNPILDRIRQDGALKSSDFVNHNKPAGGWWNWKKEKEILEYLYNGGSLMISRRVKFQREYDLAERVLPDWDDQRVPESAVVTRELALRTVQILGLAPLRWVPDYFRLHKTGLPRLFEELVEAGQLLQVQVEGWSEPAYVHTHNLALAEAAARGELRPELSTLLSPFDPLVWDRARVKALFTFDYSLECYLPAEKRVFGYFSLPILVRGALVGRLAAKAHRVKKQFEIKALHLEPDVALDDELRGEIRGAIQRCADWHRTPEILVSDPRIDWL